MTLLLGLVVLLVVTPLVVMFIGSFQLGRPGQPSVYGLDGWWRAFTDPTILATLVNTVLLSVTRQAIALVLGVFFAWLIARTDLPWNGLLEFMFWLSFFLPSLPIALGWLLVFDPYYGLANRLAETLPFIDGPLFNLYSFWGITFVHLTASTIGVKVLLLTPAFRNMDASLEESSRVHGASTLTTIFRITIPIMTPAILVSTVLGLIRSLEAFEIELLLGVPVGLHVYSTMIHEFVTFEPPEFPPASALGSIFLFILLILVAVQRGYIGGRSYHTVRGQGFTTHKIRLGRWRYPIFTLVLLTAITTTVIPVIFLVMVTFMNSLGHFDIPEPWTLENWRGVLDDPILASSLTNTLLVGTGASLVGIFFYSLIAYVVVKSRFTARGVLDFISWLPWAVPGILLSLALLWTVFQTHILTDLYGTLYLLVLAMVIKSMPVGVQLTRSVLLQLSNELEEASKTCGASWTQTYRRIVLPLLFPTLVVVGLLIFVSVARDISTVVLLGTGASRTVALVALDYTSEGALEKAAVAALITVGLVVLAVLPARIFGGRIGITR